MLKIVLKNKKKLIDSKRNLSNIQTLNTFLKNYLFDKENIKFDSTDDKSKTSDVFIKKLQDLKLPKLKMNDLDKHFNKIALNQIKEYLDLIHKFNIDQALLEIPKSFEYNAGWTRLLFKLFNYDS
jgi:hypothetical protein